MSNSPSTYWNTDTRKDHDVRARGINYDTGFLPGDKLSRKTFTAEIVRGEMAVVAGELHCDAIRISGRQPDRLAIAAQEAKAAGLEVWLAPFPVDLGPADTLKLFETCAQQTAADVFVTGCELSAFGNGFIPGETFSDRLQSMATADMAWWMSLGPVIERLNSFLAEAAETVRKHFKGRITYASGPWEHVDWQPFDIVGVDAYRATYNAENFRSELRQHFTHGKPVAVTEYGTCAYKGAGDLGGMAWHVPDGAIPDEDEQVRYLDELLTIFEEEGVDTALWFTFAAYNRRDLGSYGIVEMLDETRWQKRKVFDAMAARYARSSP
jgi:hypothetical protein